MRRALFCGAILWGVSAPSQEDVQARAFVEIATPRVAYFVQEQIQVRLRFGVEKAFLRENVIQPFRQELAVPVRIEATWLEKLPGAAVRPPENEPGGLSFVLNDELAGAVPLEDRQIDDRQFRVLEIERTFLPDRPGTLVLPAPTLRFAYATRFRDDFISGRVPEDRHEAEIPGMPVTLTIEPLPPAGRPPEFTNAVGRFSVHAAAEPRELAAGDSLRVTLRIEGGGNLEFLEPPRLEDLADFHVFGKIEDTDGTRRTITYDLTPRSENVAEVPSIPLAFFDPAPPAGYHVVRTRAIPLTVRPARPGVDLELPVVPEATGPVPGVDDIFDIKPAATAPRDANGTQRLSPTLLLAGILAPWMLALAFTFWRHVRARNRIEPDTARARAAAAAFFARPADGDLAVAFAGYLAARMRCSRASVIAPDLPARLQARGVTPALAVRATALLDRWIEGRFGGDADDDRRADVENLVEALEVDFTAAEAEE